MRSEDALRFLLLKHLWKQRSSVDATLHSEVARSLTVSVRDSGPYALAWSARGSAGSLDVPADMFHFYQRGDAAQLPPRADADNERAARLLAAQLLGIEPSTAAAPDPLPLCLDTWRWPLLCGVGAVVAVAASRSVFPLVLAGVAVVECRARVRWLYIVLLAAVVIEGHGAAAVTMALALAAATLLSSAALREWFVAGAALALAAVSMYRRPPQPLMPADATYLAVLTMVAVVAFVLLWLSFDGFRVSTLIGPLLIAPLLVDGRPALSVIYAVVCLTYLAWLSILRQRNPTWQTR